jgi:predicted O-linked N-acetylglucosamine transferase (SPINDLY family)
MSGEIFLQIVKQTTDGALPIAGLIDQANLLESGGRSDLAEQAYKTWIALNPNHPHLFVALFNCAALQANIGALDGAQASLGKALEINPDFWPAYINLGNVFEKAGALDRAVALWNTLVDRLANTNGLTVAYKATALRQISRVLLDHQQTSGATATLRQCLEINPGQRDVAEQLIALRLSQCEWPIIEPSETISRKVLMEGIHPLSMAAFTDDPLLQLATAARTIKEQSKSVRPNPAVDRRHAPIDLSDRKLRVGYVSSDLREHAVGFLMAEFFERHHRAQIEPFVYYCGIAKDDRIKQRVKDAIPNWFDIRNLDDAAAAQLIASHGIDILVDVNGHTRDSRTNVFAQRPAPIQVNWLGFPGTMGSPYHHYLIADPHIVPPEAEIFYSEKIVRLPCYQPNDRKRLVSAEPQTRAAHGLPDDAFVFCCFNGSQKINRFTFERWLSVLQAVPNGVLWLLTGTETSNEKLASYAEARGIARERLVFAGKMPSADHLARYALADLFLDTVPYGAHTTASDALWMGVPVLTLTGRSFASRVCGSLVRAAGLPETLVCETPDAYISRAIALANAPHEIEALKAQLAAARESCALFDVDSLIDHLDTLFRGMVEEYQAGRLPQPNLANLDIYFDVGAEANHEATEFLTLDDYEGWYRRRLCERHWSRPIAPDNRLWTAADVLYADNEFRQLTKQIA